MGFIKPGPNIAAYDEGYPRIRQGGSA